MIRRSTKKKKTFKLPGEIFVKHVQFGYPKVNGTYLCYYKPNPPLAHDNFPMAGMKVASYADGNWNIREQILAFIGPLPIFSLDELASNQECLTRVFYIGTLQQAAKGFFWRGPYPQLLLAGLQRGQAKHFIFEVNSHKTIPNPLQKFNVKSNRFMKLKKKEKIKCIKILKRYIKKYEGQYK